MTGGILLRKLHTQWGLAYPHEGVREDMGSSKIFIRTSLFGDLQSGTVQLETWLNSLPMRNQYENLRNLLRFQSLGIAHLNQYGAKSEPHLVNQIFAFLWLASGLAYRELFSNSQEEPICPEYVKIPTRLELIQSCVEFFPNLKLDSSNSDLEVIFKGLLH